MLAFLVMETPAYALLLALAGLADAQGASNGSGACFVAGECTNSFFLGALSTPDPQECLEFCRGTPGCANFTHTAADQNCLALGNCAELNEQTCREECYSGSASCPGNSYWKKIKADFFYQLRFSLDLVCWKSGYCQGQELDVLHVGGEDQCLEACKAAASCEWFTHRGEDGACFLFSSCLDISKEGCNTCWSGQSQCIERQGAKLLQKTCSPLQIFLSRLHQGHGDGRAVL